MPPEVLRLSMNSLIDSITTGSEVNIINNGEDIPLEYFDTDDIETFFSEKELVEIELIAGNPPEECRKRISFDVCSNGPNNCRLPETWNMAVDDSKHDWVMISNDDLIWKYGWYDKFVEQVMDGCMLIGCGFSCFLIHKDLFEMVGPFNEKLTHAYCEDTDFLLRVIQHGGIRISQEFRKYDYNCQLYGYFNHIKRDMPEVNKRLNRYWKDNNVSRPIPAGPNYEIFKEIWGFGDKDSQVDDILSSYKFEWEYK